MPPIVPTSANKTIGEETGDPVFNNALPGVLSQRTRIESFWKRRFVVYEHDRSAVLFFTIYGWKQEDIFL